MHLLDSSVTIALFASNHEDHDVADTWAATNSPLAMCPVSEGALVRYLVRLAVPAALARRTIKEIYARPDWSFIPDTVSYGDAYLVTLAKRSDAKLATLDQALAALYPGVAVMIRPTRPKSFAN